MKTGKKTRGGLRRLAAGWVAAAGLLACAAAGAQPVAHPALQDRWSFQLGAYAPKVDTNAYLNGAGGLIGTSVSFEDDLNLADRKTMPALLASVRLGERWKIEGEYFSLHRDGARAISRNINWGGSVYPVGTTVNSTFDSDVYRLSGGYAFIKDSRKELGIALGLHVTDFTASLAAAGVGARVGETLAPLPTVGAYGAYAFSSRWLLSGRLDYFTLGYDDYDGSLINFSVGADYRVSRHFGIGVAFRHVDYDITVTKSKYNGGIEYKFSGPVLYGVATF